MTAGSYRNFRSEIEMALHDHEVNRRREEQGELGGQFIVAVGWWLRSRARDDSLPPLFADDPLIRGLLVQ